MNSHLFTYGALMFPQIWSQVAEETYETIEGRVYGFKRKLLKNGTYPALTPGKDSDYIDGIIHLNVSMRDMKKLDIFEGDFYQKVTVECRLPDNSFLPASVYILRPKYSHMTINKDWNPDHFLKTVIPFSQDLDKD